MAGADDGEGYDRVKELKAFDETKAGVKGLCDSGITAIPRIFILPTPVSIHAYSPTSTAVPIIDLRKPAGKVVGEVRRAAAEWGFFQVVGHGVPPELMEAMLGGVRGFFEGDAEERTTAYSRSPERKVRWCSSPDLYRSRVANWRDSLAVKVSPDGADPADIPASCRQPSKEYLKHVSKLGDDLLQLLSQALGLGSTHLRDMECSKGQFVLCHYYPPCPQPEKAIGTSPHRDSSFLTILLQDQLGGLQVLRGDRWVDVVPTRDAFVVNIGDLLQLLSNDLFISVEHRVLASSRGPRISVAFFFSNLFEPNSDAVYGPIKELLSEGNPPIYRAVSAGDYRAHYFCMGLGETSPLEKLRVS